MKFTRLAAASAGAVLALAGCAPGAAPAGDATPAGVVTTGVPAGDVRLSLISTPESGAAMKPIIAAFEAKHPNVKIK